MVTDEKRISKQISYWLRHHPEDGGLVIDDFGWANIPDLIDALNARGHDLVPDDLIKISTSFDKIRWEIDAAENKIRATHGHSINVVIEDKITTPPAVLYHGTAFKFLESITAQGLKTMSRQFVHLSSEKDVALQVGSRHGKAVVVKVNAQLLHNAGHVFYKTSDNVWLTKEIPTAYLDFG
ncbi:MAG: RNA 2'-phosphotransferase [Bacteroidota bacterium]